MKFLKRFVLMFLFMAIGGLVTEYREAIRQVVDSGVEVVKMIVGAA